MNAFIGKVFDSLCVQQHKLIRKEVVILHLDNETSTNNRSRPIA